MTTHLDLAIAKASKKNAEIKEGARELRELELEIIGLLDKIGKKMRAADVQEIEFEYCILKRRKSNMVGFHGGSVSTGMFSFAIYGRSRLQDIEGGVDKKSFKYCIKVLTKLLSEVADDA